MANINEMLVENATTWPEAFSQAAFYLMLVGLLAVFAWAITRGDK